MTNIIYNNQIILAPLTHIAHNPFQRRTEYGDLDELAQRIAAAYDSFPDTLGLMQVPRGRIITKDGRPLTLDELAQIADVLTSADEAEWDEAGLMVQLLFGHRRYEAFCHLTDEEVGGYERGVMPIQTTEATYQDMLLAVWEENAQRKNLSAIEEAELMRDAQEYLTAQGQKVTQQDVAGFFGLQRPTVANRLQLLDLPEDIQALNRQGLLSERQCQALRGVVKLAEAIKAAGSDAVGSYWQTPPEKYLSNLLEAVRTPDSKVPTSDDIRRYAHDFERSVGLSLDPVTAKFDFSNCPHPNIRQPVCTGCPARLDRCFAKTCLNEKKRLHGEELAKAEAQKLGIGYSNEEQFLVYPAVILELWRNRTPETEKLFFVSWQPHNYYARLYPEPRIGYAAMYNTPGDEVNGLALGYTGPIPQSPESTELHTAREKSKNIFKRVCTRRDATLKNLSTGLQEALTQYGRRFEPRMARQMLAVIAGCFTWEDSKTDEDVYQLLSHHFFVNSPFVRRMNVGNLSMAYEAAVGMVRGIDCDPLFFLHKNSKTDETETRLASLLYNWSLNFDDFSRPGCMEKESYQNITKEAQELTALLAGDEFARERINPELQEMLVECNQHLAQIAAAGGLPADPEDDEDLDEEELGDDDLE